MSIWLSRRSPVAFSLCCVLLALLGNGEAFVLSDNCIPISWRGPFQTHLTCVQLSWFCVVFSPVHLFGLCGVQFRVIYWTLRWQSLYLMLLCISHVCWLISQWKKLGNGCVVSKFNYGAWRVSCCTIGSTVKLKCSYNLEMDLWHLDEKENYLGRKSLL